LVGLRPEREPGNDYRSRGSSVCVRTVSRCD
jgi:hypothetical protein